MRATHNILISGLFIIVIIAAAGCDSSMKNNSNDVAEKKNEEKFDTRAEEKEAEFVADAIAGSYAEIKLAELASTKSSNKKVQEIAQLLVKDHTDAITELKNIANQKGIAVPMKEAENVTAKVNDLASEEQPDFDKKWCDELVDKHKKTIRSYESMWEKSDDPELKEIINKTLLDLRTHLDKLNEIEKKMM